MIIEDIPSFVTALPPTGALAGLDFGDKTIGIALSDRLRGTATPMETIRRRKFTLDAAQLMELLDRTLVVLALEGL